MNQPVPPENDQPPQFDPGIQQHVENSTLGGGMQAAQGDNNIQVQDNSELLNSQTITEAKYVATSATGKAAIYITNNYYRENISVAPTESANGLVDFENDIFISYAHIDNQPLSEGQSGWISDFHRVLEIRLAQLRGEKARICRSLKLQENDDFEDEIVVQFPKAALLVSVLSPCYLKSTWCIKELQEFCKSAEQTGGIRVAGNKARIFKVIKTPIPPEQQPQELRSLLSYEFYQGKRVSNAIDS